MAFSEKVITNGCINTTCKMSTVNILVFVLKNLLARTNNAGMTYP
jgi:hypothetical protein